jgi:L-aminopeptidase/D-esterase-like protein
MSVPLANDHVTLRPQTNFDSPVLEFDFPGLEIGVAEYAEGPTGCTVFHFPAGVATAVDIRGGYPGVVGNYEWNHAICFAGGSLYGLEAAFGVTAELFARRNYATEWGAFALVSGAIIYDYGRRETRIYPDKALGRAALQAARAGVFPLGARGVGRSASCGWFAPEASGQGAAFRQIGDVKIAVFIVVNATGVVVNRQGEVVRGNLDTASGRRYPVQAELEKRLGLGMNNERKQGNTTLTLVVTNLKLDGMSLRQLSKQVHTSLARAIQPFHTMGDGDVLYAVTTNEVEHTGLDGTDVGVFAADVAWDAVLSSAA